MKEIIFLALVIVSVYQVSTLADVLVFNSIEFWTGDNPIKTARTGAAEGLRPSSLAGVQATVIRKDDGQSSRIEYRRGTEVVARARIVEEGNRYRLLTERGQERYSVQSESDGGLTLVDHDGHVVETISAGQIDAVASLALDLEIRSYRPGKPESPPRLDPGAGSGVGAGR